MYWQRCDLGMVPALDQRSFLEQFKGSSSCRFDGRLGTVQNRGPFQFEHGAIEDFLFDRALHPAAPFCMGSSGATSTTAAEMPKNVTNTLASGEVNRMRISAANSGKPITTHIWIVAIRLPRVYQWHEAAKCPRFACDFWSEGMLVPSHLRLEISAVEQNTPLAEAGLFRRSCGRTGADLPGLWPERAS